VRLIHVDAPATREYIKMIGEPISSAPFDCDLEFVVIIDVSVPLVFQCRSIQGGGWINSETKRRVEVWPTHWQLRSPP
jgi:hypothetical protein